jgi:hypothetical protein
MNYASAFPEEIEAAVSDADAVDRTSLARTLPQLEELVAPSAKSKRRRAASLDRRAHSPIGRRGSTSSSAENGHQVPT